ncbi:vigilin [Nephila pilipes]|uniref:Vigilin n=1 Tax=Nephila pilipes TaxID=299642 RepID=A0A8X6N0W1_NEPPI|nr:vigilin [Nephila pilipes]
MKPKKHLEISNEKQLVGHTAEIKTNPEQYKFLISKKGASIKKVRDKTGIRIVFPDVNDDKNTITIIGRKEEVEAARKELNSLIAQLKDTAEATTEIDPKHYRYFVTREILKQIPNDYGGDAVSSKISSNSCKVVLKGTKDFFEPAKQRLYEIVENLEAMVTVEGIILQEYHHTVLGTIGSKVQNIQWQFNATIKFPDREKPQYDKVTMNGDAHADGLEDEFQVNFEVQRDELKKHTKQQIFKIQDENRKMSNLRRREPKSYRV